MRYRYSYIGIPKVKTSAFEELRQCFWSTDGTILCYKICEFKAATRRDLLWSNIIMNREKHKRGFQATGKKKMQTYAFGQSSGTIATDWLLHEGLCKAFIQVNNPLYKLNLKSEVNWKIHHTWVDNYTGEQNLLFF